ncbi:MAG: Hpt domain-containing protein [Polyangiaceae bacterium]
MTALPLLDRERLFSVVGEDRALRHSLIELFSVETARRLRELGAAIERGDADRVIRLAHTLKGSCASVGAARAAEIAEQMVLRADRRGAASLVELEIVVAATLEAAEALDAA